MTVTVHFQEHPPSRNFLLVIRHCLTQSYGTVKYFYVWSYSVVVITRDFDYCWCNQM